MIIIALMVLANGAVLAFGAYNWWTRRHLTDHQLFPELRQGPRQGPEL